MWNKIKEFVNDVENMIAIAFLLAVFMMVAGFAIAGYIIIGAIN